VIGRRARADGAVAAWSVASALLRYPDAQLLAALPAIREAALAARVPRAREVAALIDAWRDRSLTDLQAEYVEVFDMGRRTSLYMSWHQYGDQRQRGLVLIKLKRAYQEHGMAPVEDELPDWLPLMLQFAALAPAPAGVELLQKWRAPVELVRRGLHEQGKQQAVLLDLVSATLPKLGANVSQAVEKLLLEGPPTEEVGLEPFANTMPEVSIHG
jgi:nitrate reductase delta subunit